MKPLAMIICVVLSMALSAQEDTRPSVTGGKTKTEDTAAEDTAALIKKLGKWADMTRKFAWQKSVDIDRKLIDRAFDKLKEMNRNKYTDRVKVRQYNDLKRVLLILSIKRTIAEGTRLYIRNKFDDLVKTRLDKTALKMLDNFEDIQFKRGIIDTLIKLPSDMYLKPSSRERALHKHAKDPADNRQDAVVISTFLLLYRLKNAGVDAKEQMRIQKHLQEMANIKDPKKKLEMIRSFKSPSKLHRYVEGLIEFELKQENISRRRERALRRQDTKILDALKDEQMKLDVAVGDIYIEILDFVRQAIDDSIRDEVMPEEVKQRLYQNMFWNILNGLNLEVVRKRNYRKLLMGMHDIGMDLRRNKLLGWLERSGFRYIPYYIKITEVFFSRQGKYIMTADGRLPDGEKGFLYHEGTYHPIGDLYVRSDEGEYVKAAKEKDMKASGKYAVIPNRFRIRKKTRAGWKDVLYFDTQKAIMKYREQ